VPMKEFFVYIFMRGYSLDVRMLIANKNYMKPLKR